MSYELRIVYKLILFMLFFVLFSKQNAMAQVLDSIPSSTTEERAVEDALLQADARMDDDEWVQRKENLKKNKINLNTCDANLLRQLPLLNEIQIHSFLQYRLSIGSLISIYELQAVPYWDVNTIKKILPFVDIQTKIIVNNNYRQTLLLRTGWSNNNLIDSSISSTYWQGNAQRAMIRYIYQQQKWQAGFLVEKDAGEPFKGTLGFDHLSFHAMVNKLGPFEKIIIGDYTINAGQGLMQWQNFALGKGAEVMGIERTGLTLRPYNSSGEFFYYTGIATQWHSRFVTVTAYASQRKLTVTPYEDTITGKSFFTSINTSGYHRTALELARRNNNTLQSGGAIVQYENNQFSIGIQAVLHGWSMLYKPREEPYQFPLSGGKYMMNTSLFYNYTWRNYHLFGEAAIDKDFNHAILQGVLISVDKKVDISLLYRNIQPGYQAIFTNAFIASTNVQNENGLYIGLQIKPIAKIRISAFADIITYPWLRYQVDAPSNASDYFVQLEYKPKKTIEWIMRFRKSFAIKNGNIDGPLPLTEVQQDQLRFQVSIDGDPVSYALRFDVNQFKQEGNNTETGMSAFFNASLHFPHKPWSLQTRLGYFDIDSYNNRIFAFEQDVLYKNTLTSVWGAGWRFYVNGKYSLNKHIVLFAKIGSTQQATKNDKNPFLMIYKNIVEYTAQVLFSF